MTDAVETVTVLFTDLVGSTDLRVAVGEEESDCIRRAHDDAVQRGVHINRGRIAKHTGDGVMALFDGASDAVNAAVAIQQAIYALNRAGDHPTLRVRIGISVGDVTIEGDDCFGLPVVEAQRLEASAEPGTIRCSSLVKALARGRGGHEFAPLGELSLKGLDEPLPAEEVRWQARADADLVTAPPVLASALRASFTGRDAERAAVAECWNRARGGTTEVVLLAGEPGAGKTALAAQFTARVLATGGTVLAGRSDELVRAPYQPFLQVLRELLPIDPEWHAALAPLASSLGFAVAPVRRADIIDPDAERALLFDTVRALLRERAGGPFVLVLDDLHWADDGTLLLLRHVAATSPVPGLLVLATYRDTEIDPAHPLTTTIAELRRAATVTRIGVEPLDVESIATLAGELAGTGTVIADLASAIHTATAGNAFFVCEVLRHLAEGGQLHADSGDLELPEGVRDVVSRRVSLLDDASQQALSAASVAGTTFRLDTLAAALDKSEDDVFDAIEPALDAHLVTESGPGRFGFTHALVRSTLYQRLSITRRARLHRRVAEALEVADPDAAAELAGHWAHAGGAEANARAAVHAARAAEQAAAALALDDSVRWYRTALELLDGVDAVAEAEMTTRLARAAAAAVSADHRELVNLAARRAGDAGAIELMAEAALLYRRRNFAYGDTVDPEHMAQLEEVLTLLPQDAADLRAAVLAELALELVYVDDVDRRAELIAQIETLLPEVADRRLRAQIAQRVTVAEPTRHLSADSVRRRTEDVVATLETESLPLAMDVDLSLFAFLMSLMLGDRPRADWAAARLERFEASGQHHDRCVAAGMLSMMAGRLDDAELHTEQLASIIAGMPHADAVLAGRRFLIALERGDAAVLGPTADIALSMADAMPVVPAMATLALLAVGREDEARACVERHASVLADFRPDATVPITLGLWPPAAAGTRHVPSCTSLRELLALEPRLHHVTGGFYLGARTHSLGLLAHALGELDEASAWFQRAVEDHRAIGSPPYLARSLTGWAEVELDRGDATLAEQLATAAIEAIAALPTDAVRRDATRVRDAAVARLRDAPTRSS